MSATQQVLLGGGDGQRFNVTISDNGASSYGMATVGGSFGSVSPSTYKRGGSSYTISRALSFDNGTTVRTLDFSLNTSGLPQTLFRGIEAEDGNGVLHTFYTASADFFSNVSGTRWQWDTTTGNTIWKAADAGEVRVIRIFT